MKFNEDDWVIIKKTLERGIVTRCLPHPYIPKWLNWLIKPCYLVRIAGYKYDEVFKQSELQRIK